MPPCKCHPHLTSHGHAHFLPPTQKFPSTYILDSDHYSGFREIKKEKKKKLRRIPQLTCVTERLVKGGRQREEVGKTHSFSRFFSLSVPDYLLRNRHWTEVTFKVPTPCPACSLLRCPPLSEEPCNVHSLPRSVLSPEPCPGCWAIDVSNAADCP